MGITMKVEESIVEINYFYPPVVPVEQPLGGVQIPILPFLTPSRLTGLSKGDVKILS
jgi:hypothetical protein